MAENRVASPTPKKANERLIQARKAAGYGDATAAAAAMGVKSATYLGHENGSRGFTFNAQRYSDFFKINLDWLIAGRGVMKRQNGDQTGESSTTAASVDDGTHSVTTPDISVRQWPRDVPILGSASCGEDGMFELNGQTHGFARRPPRLIGVKDAYALYVHGESMSPWREPGQFVIVDPHQPPQVGDYVVVQLKQTDAASSQRAYIKRLVRRTARDLKLLQFRPEEELAIPMAKVASIHRVIDWPEIFGAGL